MGSWHEPSNQMIVALFDFTSFASLNERISVWVHFLNLTMHIPIYLNFLKQGFLRQDLEGTLHIWKRFLKGFLQFSWNKHSTLSKMTQNLKLRAYLMQNFMELDMRQFQTPKLTFWFWGLKNSLGQLCQSL